MKKGIIIIGAIVGLGVAWYLVSPLWRNIQLNETVPVTPSAPSAVIPMDEKTKEEFTAAMDAAKGNILMKTEKMPSAPTVLAEAAFVAGAHDVAGKALIIESGGKKFLRFENFKTINGPNLHIYFGADLEGKDFVDLGKIRATEGNVNYELPPDIDLTKYTHVMVWCVPFKVLFSYAQLAL